MRWRTPPSVPGSAAPVNNAESSERLVVGRWPVWEALRANGSRVTRVLLARNASGQILRWIERAARNRSVPVVRCPAEALDRLTRQRHQGVAAALADAPYRDLEAWLSGLVASQALAVALDGVQDPHNLGAVLRAACLFGVSGVILPARRTCGLTPGVWKASAGAAGHVPVVRVGNLHMTLRRLKEEGFRVIGADLSGRPVETAERSRPLCLVMGAEDEGLSRLIRETCDELVRIPTSGPISSLNLSCAAAILLYALARK